MLSLSCFCCWSLSCCFGCFRDLFPLIVGRASLLVPWQILPLILMFVMFGPIILSGLIFVCDYVVNSEWGIKIGLADDPRTRLTKFYKKHNPTKMRDVRKNGGRDNSKSGGSRGGLPF